MNTFLTIAIFISWLGFGPAVAVIVCRAIDARDARIARNRPQMPCAACSCPALALHTDDGEGYCSECHRGWPCATRRAVTNPTKENVT